MTAFDAAGVQLDAVLAQQPQVQLPRDSRSLRMQGQCVPKLGECGLGRRCVDGAVPLDGGFKGFAVAEGEQSATCLTMWQRGHSAIRRSRRWTWHRAS